MEKLKKVNSFSELKVGQIVVVKNCEICNKAKCRGILYEFKKDKTYGAAFLTLPNCGDISEDSCITQPMVEDGYVYLVEDGLEDMDEVENKKKLETVE